MIKKHPHNRAERMMLAKKKKNAKNPYPRRQPEEEEEDGIREEVRREIWESGDR